MTETPGDDELEPYVPSRAEQLREQPRPTELLLWVDLETGPTGDRPDAATDTILEAAWCVTYRRPPGGLRSRRPERWRGSDRIDLSDWQLTPLRSRLCSIGPTPDYACVPSDDMRWAESDIAPRVAEMHETSGLTSDHISAQYGDRIVGTAAELERLVLDDLHAAIEHVVAAEGDLPVVYIAGDGVGHYDQPLLSRGQFTRLARYWHYRPEDVSHAVHTLAPVRHPMALMLAGHVAADLATVLAAGLDVDPRIDLSGDVDDELIRSWLSAEEPPHRAAPDVVRSMCAFVAAREIVGDALLRQF